MKNRKMLINGDCLEVMDRLIADGVTVDAIITDPPYGTTACKWDSVIPFDEMWDRLNKLIKPNGAVVLFGSEPFSSSLRMSNIKNYKYDWVWDKKIAPNFASANKQPLRVTENVLIFNKHNYYPLKTKGKMRKKGGGRQFVGIYGDAQKDKITKPYLSDMYHPINIIDIQNASRKGKVHPTQKPVDLMEYLIKTYTKEGETVLDFTCGSGSTGVACRNTNRNFIGIDSGICKKEGKFKNWKWIDVAKWRIENDDVSPSIQEEKKTDLISEFL